MVQIEKPKFSFNVMESCRIVLLIKEYLLMSREPCYGVQHTLNLRYDVQLTSCEPAVFCTITCLGIMIITSCCFINTERENTGRDREEGAAH